MGSCRRAHSRSHSEELQGLPAFHLRTERTRCLSEGEPQIWTDPTLQVPDGRSGHLCKKEGQETPSGAGLPCTERHDHEEQVPASLNSGADCEAPQSQVLHEVGCLVGLQQRPDKGRRPVEGCLPDQPRLVRTPCHVLWPHEQSRHLPDDDGRHL